MKVGCVKMWRRLTWPCRQVDVRASSTESPAADIRRPYTQSTPCRRGVDTGSSAVSGTAVCALAAVAETRLSASVTVRAAVMAQVEVMAPDAATPPAWAEEEVPLQKT